MKRALILLLLACLGCASAHKRVENDLRREMHGYVGASEGQLLARLGQPDETYPIHETIHFPNGNTVDADAAWVYHGTVSVPVAVPVGVAQPTRPPVVNVQVGQQSTASAISQGWSNFNPPAAPRAVYGVTQEDRPLRRILYLKNSHVVAWECHWE